MTHVRKARSYARQRRWFIAAIVALAVGLSGAMVAAGASTAGKSPSKAGHNSLLAVTATTDSCGYPFGTGLTATTFNESTVLKGFSGTALGTSTATVNVFYEDEWELNLGTAPITNWQPTYLKSGTTNTYADDAGSNPNNIGNGSARTTTLVTGGGVDPEGRPKAPSIFVTDVTGTNATANTPESGDWQMGGLAQNPSFVAGMWKPDGAGHNGTIVNGKFVAYGANKNFLGPHADAFQTNINTTAENYGAETRYDVSNLHDEAGQTVKPGHTYKVQMMIHDGDHVSDTGEACRLVTIPKAPSTTKTTPAIKVSESININIGINAATGAQASVKDGDTVTVRLVKRGDAPNSTRVNDQGQTVNARGCTATNQAGTTDPSATAAMQQGSDDVLTIDNTAPYDPGTYRVDSNGNLISNDTGQPGELTYPDDFGGSGAPALVTGASPTGDYWWFVQYSGNDEVNASNDDCSENFNLNVSFG